MNAGRGLKLKSLQIGATWYCIARHEFRVWIETLRSRSGQQREVPSRVFFDLATWHLIGWQYQPCAISQAQALRVNYSQTQLHARLMTVLEHRHGHHMAHQVEQAKIRCSQLDRGTVIDLSIIEAGLHAPLQTADLQGHLAGLLARTVACARDCVRRAGLRDGELDAITSPAARRPCGLFSVPCRWSLREWRWWKWICLAAWRLGWRTAAAHHRLVAQ